MGLGVPNRYRVRIGPMRSDDSQGNNGLFMVPTFDGKVELTVIASDEGGWDHVSVSVAKPSSRIPSWGEMEYIKRMFWDPEDVVLQFHPPRKKYINKCKYCLHMWRKTGVDNELPPAWMVA